MIDDELFVSVKKLAAEEGCSVSFVVAEALRGFLGNRDRPASRPKFHMPTFDGGGKPIDSLPLELHQMDEEAELAPFSDEAL